MTTPQQNTQPEPVTVPLGWRSPAETGSTRTFPPPTAFEGYAYGAPSSTATGRGPGTSYAPASTPYATPAGPAAPPPTDPDRPDGGAEPAPPRKPRTVLTAVTAAVLAAALASGGTAALLRDDTSAAASSGDPVTQVQGVSAAADGSPDWEAVAAAARPSVVAIDVATAAGGAAGSGVILDAEGHVLTNNHVVEGARQVQVMLWDGRLYEAEVVGLDPTTDLAVIRLVDPPSDLEPATLGTSDDLEVGEPVMAVGNPLGLASTVTTGIISALDRPVAASSQTSQSTSVTNAIQIDAAINPGNSGGPLFDAQGLVIGITSSIATLPGGMSGNIGLGFAIPIDLATSIANQLIENGAAEHAYLGVTLRPGEASADGVRRQGAEVVEVAPDTPAAEAGVQPGDVVVGIDDRTVSGAESLTGYVRQHAAGDEVTLTVIRDGESLEITVTLATREEG
ncbi:MAG TPA: trypsin-like peptidase domain-containing protein [Actinotalea caeni]|uniref:S1C family serine protease n=1 Tax=Actinotalea caeni TaxID=1348467 RepID=UPI001956174B|nr:trypsin-like peptidase domain-containing protein [Actinotalea caeni]HLV56700.1 trypsin-like peptidase domain-containing protein [Actinotalea caeni]